jgi:hypothetical protein
VLIHHTLISKCFSHKEHKENKERTPGMFFRPPIFVARYRQSRRRSFAIFVLFVAKFRWGLVSGVGSLEQAREIRPAKTP